MALTRLPGFVIDSTSSFTFAEANVTGNLIAPNIYANTTVNFIGANNVSLGSVSNLHISGGASGYVLQTDGTGNLSWIAQSGGGGGGASYNPVLDTFTGTGSQTAFNLSVTPATIYNTIVNIDGVSQLHDAYTLAGTTITFDSAPSNGAIIEVLVLATTATGGIPGGSNTQVQFNNDGNFGGSAGLTFDSTTTTLTSNNLVVSSYANLGSVSNVTITGGSSGQYLQTDGSGNLSWSTVISGSTSNISNGNSNVNIPTANGNVIISSAGNANVLVITGTGINVAGTIDVTGNANVGNISATNGVFTNVSGNGSGLTAVTGASVTGTVANATHASTSNTVVNAAQPNITSLGTLTGLTSNGTINFTPASNVSLGAVGNIKITGGTSGYVLQTDGTGNLSWVAQSSGGGSSISNGTSNVNIATSDGNVTTSVGGTANVLVVTSTGANIAGTINVTGNAIAGNLIGTYANGNSNVNIPAANGNINLSASGNANVLVVTGTGIIVAGSISTSGSSGNISGVNYVIANFFSGSGNNLSNLQAANISGAVANANYSLYAGTLLTNAQPNITSVGTLTDLNVSGNAVVGGNLTVSGDLVYVNVTNLSVKDPIIQLQTGANGAAPTSNSGKDVGTALNYYDTAARVGFMGWDTSNAEIALASNVTIANEVATFNQYANVRANYFIGNGSALTSLPGANVTGQVANALVAGTVYTNAQPNITSVGLLSALSVGPNSGITLTGTSGYIRANSIQGTDGVAAIYPAYSGVTGAVGITGNLTVGTGTAGNITANGNVTASYFIGNGSSLTNIAAANVTGQVANALVAGTVYTNAQPNITSLGTLSNLTSNGTINFTNASNVSLGAVGNIKITGGTSGYVLSTDGVGNLSWVAQSGGGGGGAANITIESEGNVLTTAVSTIDFVGSGVIATNVGNVVTITVPGLEAGTGTYLTRTYTGDGNAVSYIVTNGVTVNSVIVALNGILQTPTTDYTVSSNVLTFTAAPAANETIQIREFGTAIGGSNTQIQFNDNGGFGGNANLTFDKTTGTLNATNVTANGTPLATTGKAIAMAIVFGF